MPDSIRDLLQGIAGDEPGPSQDLASGALRRARNIGRRRFAAGAIAAICGLAMASAATAAVVNGSDPNAVPPAGETSSEGDPVEETGEPSESEEGSGACEPPEGWTGWGPSGTETDLTALPESPVFEVNQDGASEYPEFFRYEDDEPIVLLQADGEYYLAPDGQRFAVGGAEECSSIAHVLGEKLDDVPIFSMYCAPAWSPDSDRVVLNIADPENSTAYLLDVATGETTEVADEVGCSSKWSADGEFLVTWDGTAAMRPDGSGRVELAGAAVWAEDPTFMGLSSISADLSRACLEFDDSEGAEAGHGTADRCDRYVDTATGEELELPVETQTAQVVFLADGSMIVTDDQYGTIVVSLVDAGGDVLDTASYDALGSGGTFLRGYFTG